MTLLADMSSGTGLPVPFVNGIGRKASHAYKTFEIPKRSGGSRQIAHPARPLKALQRWLLRAVIEKWPVHSAAFGYVRAKNIYLHASQHARSRYLLRMDFEEFFPSITASDVAAYLGNGPLGTEDWTSEDFQLFVQLVTRSGRLTIGAPTSPTLSNALCFDLDTHCAALASDQDLCYTRYADDLFFSAAKRDILRSIPSAVAKILNDLLVPRGLRLNASKERHSSKKRRRQITGIVVTSDGRAALGRERKRFIRSQIHKFTLLNSAERESLRGLISFGADIEKSFVNALILKYGHDVVMSAWKG